MNITVPQKYTSFGSKSQLVIVIWTQMRPAGTTKNEKGSVVWFLVMQVL
jgi:hypothetical protein